ncbi:MAG TPA: hypothetical protein V6C99_05265 [Oculatellaceae cyanobacterium]|jgi:hypothetical protein
MNFKYLAVLSAFCLITTYVWAEDDLADAYREGYKLWRKTSVKGSFTGCTPGKVIQFTNGLSFQCHEKEDSDSRNSEVKILKHPKTGRYKIFIGGEDYDGQLKGLKK